MASCDLRIELEHPDARHRAGDRIAGEVVVRASEDVSPRKLLLETEWRTHGRGNRARGGGATQELHGAARWRAGEEYRYPFELTAPDGPFTYHGKLLNVDWYLRARADVAWAFDPKCETEFLLEGSDSEEPDLGPMFKRPDGRSGSAPGGCGLAFVALFGIAFAIPGFMTMAIGARELVQGGMHGIFLLGFGGVFALVGLGLTGFMLRNRIAQARLGVPKVTVIPPVLRPGGRVQVQLHLRPRASITVKALTATLHAREIVVSGSGTNATTHTHTCQKIERTLGPAGGGFDAGYAADGGSPAVTQMVHDGRELWVETFFDIDRDAGTSFAASSNRLQWGIEVHVDIEGWPDWKEEFPIAVLPARRETG